MALKGLIIRRPWIDLILSGQKTWEMRSQATSSRGLVALIEKGSGNVVGVARLDGSLPPIRPSDMPLHFAKHRVPQQLVEEPGFNWLTPWVVTDARRLDNPIPYCHKSGAVIWVALEPGVETAVRNAVSGQNAVVPIVRSAIRLAEKAAINGVRHPSEGIRIPLTGGNIRNSHFYLRAVRHLLPRDAIGGSNKSAAGQPISVSFAPGQTIETDIDGEKMIFRDRAAVRAFFDVVRPQEGDHVLFRRLSERRFAASLERAEQ